VQISIFGFFYKKLAIFLNDFENHRTDTEYEDALIVKTTIFNFVNAYLALFYLAFFKPNANLFGISDSCRNDDCMTEVTIHLGSIFITRVVVGNLQESLFPYFSGKFRMVSEQVFLTEAEAGKKFQQWERESKLDVFEGTFDEYEEMVIQFGFITLFVAAFPIAPLLALINNLIEIRTDAVRLCALYQRPAPLMAEDIGTWFGVLQAMGVISVMTNSVIIAFTSTILNGEELYVRFITLMVAEHMILFIKFIVAEMIPDIPEDVMLHRMRENYQIEEAAKRIIMGNPEQRFKITNAFEDIGYKYDVDEQEEAADLATYFQNLWTNRAEIDEFFPSEIPYYDRSLLGTSAK